MINMRVSRGHQSLLFSFFAIIFLALIFLACILATLFHVNLLPTDLPSRFKRSLPGSLAVAPAGAVGYYHPPPGPLVDQPQPTETPGLPSQTATAAREFMHELRQAPSDQADHSTATVTATATVTQNIMATDATAMADGRRALSTTGLYLSVLLAVLHL